MAKNRNNDKQQREIESNDHELLLLNEGNASDASESVFIDIPMIDEEEESPSRKETDPCAADIPNECRDYQPAGSISSDGLFPDIFHLALIADSKELKKNVNMARGKTQHTALHVAAAKGKEEAVKTLLLNGADPNAQDSFGRTPLFIASAMGNGPCLAAMISAHADPNIPIPQGDIVQSSTRDYLPSMNVPWLVWSGSTALHEAVRANAPECVKILLDAGADVMAEDDCGATPLLLAGAGLLANQLEAVARYEEVVRLLVAKGADGNANNKGMATSALLNAVFLGSVPALKSLMSAGANPGWSSEDGGNTTAVHEAAGRGRADMLRVLICHEIDKRKRQELANKKDAIERTPLHKAAYAGSRECLSLLLECGANLSLATRAGTSGIEAVLKHVPDSKTFILSLLDSCVSCTSCSRELRDFALYLEFGFLAPQSNHRQTAVLNALFTGKSIDMENKRALLLHPLVEAFVRFKWHELRKYFVLVVVMNVLFVLTLSVFVTLEIMYHENMSDENDGLSVFIRILRYFHLLIAFIVLVNVLGKCIIHFRYYVRQYETWTNGLSAMLSILWTLASDPAIILSKEVPQWFQHIIPITLPLAWAGMMLLLGRFPIWGSRALLFGVVLRNVLWTLLVLGFMIIGFSVSFFVQFHESNPDAFGDPWKAFFNTMVMMTGEYEYLDIFNDKKIFLPVTSRVLYFIFIVVASIVLVNLIVGLAVTDTQAMNSEGEARSLYKRAEFVDFLECIPGPIASRCALNKSLKIKIHGRPGEKNHIIKHILPKCLVDSLVNIALTQRKKEQNFQIPKGLSFTFPKTNEGSLEQQICTIAENFVKEIFIVIQANKDTKQ